MWFEGQILLSSFPRIGALFGQPANAVAMISLKFTADAGGLFSVTGQVSASISLECDRCREPGNFNLESNLALKLVKDEDAAELLEGVWEPWLIQKTQAGKAVLDIYEMIEDELLLCLPYEFMHPLEHCAAQKYIVTLELEDEPQDVKVFN